MSRAYSVSCSVIGAKASVKADQKISLIENEAQFSFLHKYQLGGVNTTLKLENYSLRGLVL